jgi:hypothetical protein
MRHLTRIHAVSENPTRPFEAGHSTQPWIAELPIPEASKAQINKAVLSHNFTHLRGIHKGNHQTVPGAPMRSQ